MTDQATTWTGKLSLTQLPYLLCPGLQRRFVRAAMIGSRAQPLPRRVAARLPACITRLANEAIARLLTSDNPPAFDGLEDAQREEARKAAELAVRVAYRKKAGTLRQRISRRVAQAIADGEHFCFTGRRGDRLDDPIPAHLATRLQVDARTVSLPPDGDDDQGAVWRDVFVTCTPPKKKRGPRSYKDAALVAEVRAAVKSGPARSFYGAAFAIVERIPGAGTPESRARRIANAAAKS